LLVRLSLVARACGGSWLRRQKASDDAAALWRRLFEQHVPTALQIVQTERIASIVPVPAGAMVATLCAIFEVFCRPRQARDGALFVATANVPSAVARRSTRSLVISWG
jgi:hypothetical protein